MSRVEYLTKKLSTKFEVDTTIRCLVIALLLLICYVTLWPCPLTLVSSHTWWVTWSTPPPPSLKILRISVVELWVLTSRIGYQWQCVCSHGAWRMRRIMWPMRRGYIFTTHLKSLTPNAYSLYNLYGTMIKTNGVIRQNSVWPCDKHHIALCSCTKSRQPWTMP